MAKIVELDWNPDRRTLRQFGWIALLGFGGVALLAWQEWLIFSFGLGEARPWVAGGLAGLGLLAAFFGLVAPSANKPLFIGIAVLTFPIGFVLSYLIMGLLFYAVIAPVGLLLRLAGKDPMARRLEPDSPSYWSEARPTRPRESYFRQY